MTVLIAVTQEGDGRSPSYRMRSAFNLIHFASQGAIGALAEADQAIYDAVDERRVGPWTVSHNDTSSQVFLHGRDSALAVQLWTDKRGIQCHEAYICACLPHSGTDNELSELLRDHQPDDLNQADIDYLIDLAKAAEMDLPDHWRHYVDEVAL